MPDLTIDIHTEISCPWCAIGLHRLDKVLAERFPTLSVDIMHHPVFLMPGCPPEGVRIADILRSKYGIADPSAAWARPQSEARASGLDLDLSRQPFAYPTEAAHTLIRLARSRGTQHKLAVAISHAYFLEGRNIADHVVLTEIAAKHGFEKAEVPALITDPTELEKTELEAAEGQAIGVQSVPHFIFGRELTLIGGRSEDELATAIEQTARNEKARA